MKFKKLAETFSKLESTASRNTMTEILSQLLGETDPDEVAEIVYLSLGNLGPSYDRVQFNLAEKQVVKSLARAFDVGEDEVTKKYKEIGDLGDLAQRLAPQESEKNLEVKEVYDELMGIAKDDGGGSQERKIFGLSELLKNLDGLSVRYVVRVVLGRLRLGFLDKTVLDALSWMEKGDKSEKDELELAYQIRPDIGRLVEEVKRKGTRETVKNVKAELGVPIMPMLCQRLKSTEEMVKKMGEVAVEPKFDGTRVQIHFKRGKDGFVRTFTRNLEETSHMFPELSSMGDHVEGDGFILDSEAIGYDPETGKLLPFQTTITRKRKHGIEEQAGKVPLKFFVFDVMYKDGESLIDKRYEERRKILKEIVKSKGLLVVDDYWVTDDPKKIKDKHEELLKEGLEGVIVKDMESKYVPGRTGWRWVKMKEVEESYAKLSDTLDCVVMGYYVGKGKRTTFGLGAFLVGVRKGDEIVTIAKIGTGLSDDQFREMKIRLDKLVSSDMPKAYVLDKNLEPDVWTDPGLVVEIAADEITKSPIHSAGVALRFPRLIKFRDDKDVNGATTVEEVKAIM